LQADWERVRRTALATLRAKGLTEDEAEDVAQDVTLALMRGRTGPEEWQDFGRYVRSAASHEFGRFVEAKRRRTARERREAIELACSAPGPEELADALGDMAECLVRLDEAERRLVALVAVGMTSRQVGALLGISAEAARKRLQRVRAVMRVKVVEGD